MITSDRLKNYILAKRDPSLAVLTAQLANQLNKEIQLEVQTTVHGLLQNFIDTHMKELKSELADKLQEEYKALSNKIWNENKVLLKGEKGDSVKGDSYILSSYDREAIAEMILRVVVERFTEKTEVVKETPVIKEVAKFEEAEKIAKKLNTLKSKVDKSVIRGLEEEFSSIRQAIRETRQSRRARRFGGGGDVVVAGSNVTVTRLAGGKRSIASTGGGAATIYSETPTGTIDDSNVTFTVLNSITTVVTITINGQYIHPVNYSTSGTTITFGSPIGLALAGLPFTIVYT